MTKDQIYQLGYSAECDGYDRAWMALVATNRRDLDHYVRGANAARADLETDARRFTPSLHPRHLYIDGRAVESSFIHKVEPQAAY